MEQVNYWSLLGGLGLFLFGMLVFEETISHLGKGFLKKVLGKYTKTRLGSVMTGLIQTCIFQSSTIVTMMTLGFVGAGVIGLSNALGVVIGANVGSTLTPWLVSFLGFKLDIESFALPMIAVGGIATILFSKSEKVINVSKFLIGFGLLFLGLSYMKESVEIISQHISLAQYSHFSIWGYVLIGTILTTVMQTSTGATVITLTALSANIITLDMALGLVIGANLGSAVSTSIIGLLSSTPTQTQKKKVALSHLVFNISTTLIVTLLYPYIRDFLIYILPNKNDHVTLLALFHTTFNVVLALIWTPLIGKVLPILNKIFPSKASELHLAIDHINTTLAEEVLPALRRDTLFLLGKVEEYNRHVLYLDNIAHYPQKTHDDYVTIKEIESKILTYIINTHGFGFTKEQGQKIHVLHDSIMNALTSCKYLKDIQHHIINLKDDSLTNDIIAQSLHLFQEMATKTSNTIKGLNPEDDPDNNIASLQLTIDSLHIDDDLYLEGLTTQSDTNNIDNLNVAEIIKTNRYVLLSCETLLQGHIDYLKQEVEITQQ